MALRRAAYQRTDYEKYVQRTYGLTKEGYDRLVVEQGNRCAICRTDEPPKWKGRKWATWHIDHDHVTGIVRGLLCFNCNSGLGHFKDSEARLSAAMAYLRRAVAQEGAA